jgi:hypothetical protein
MKFGLESRVTRRRAMMAGAALLSTLGFALVGCGGGGGDPGTDPTPAPGSRVAVTGRVIDVGNNLPVPGASISFNGVTTVTNNDGTFSVGAPPTTTTQNVSVAGPLASDKTPAYHATVAYKGRTYGSGSFPIDATSKGGTTVVDLGDVFIANLSYPPYPPSFD